MFWLGICENFSPPKFKRSIFVTKTVDPLSISDLLDHWMQIVWYKKTSLRVQLYNFCEVEMLPTGCRTTGLCLYPDSRPKGSTSSGCGVLGTSRWSRPSDSWSDGERRSLPRAVSARCRASARSLVLNLVAVGVGHSGVSGSGAGPGPGGRVAASAPAPRRSACHSPLLFHSSTPPPFSLLARRDERGAGLSERTALDTTAG